MAGINPDYPGWDYALDREFRQDLEQIGMWRQLIGLCHSHQCVDNGTG